MDLIKAYNNKKTLTVHQEDLGVHQDMAVIHQSKVISRKKLLSGKYL